MTTEGNVVAGMLKDIDYLKTQMGDVGVGSGISWFKIRKNDLTLTCSMSIYDKTLGSSFVVGHSRLGWVGFDAGSMTAGSQPYIGDSKGAWTFQNSGDTMVFTDVGKDVLIGLMSGRQTAPNYIGAGSSSTTAVSGDTTLGSEYATGREAVTSYSSGADWIEFETIWGATNPTEQPCWFREMGLFSGSPTGSLVQHSTFTAYEKTQDKELQGIIRLDIA